MGEPHSKSETIAIPNELLGAYVALEVQAEKYHEDCGHDTEGAASECDAICAAWKALRETKARLQR